jgi:hypothetical protein
MTSLHWLIPIFLLAWTATAIYERITTAPIVEES